MRPNSTLIFQLYTGREGLPVPGARVIVTNPTTGTSRTLTSDNSGKTPPLGVTAPDLSLSLAPDPSALPYSRYNARIEAAGYIPVTVTGIQVFAGVEAIEALELAPRPRGPEGDEDVVVIEGNALEQSVPRDPDSIPPDDRRAIQPRIQREVFIPEYITVHLGRPDNASAQNVTVPFPDYIKNVASSEIYPTWPENALRANILAQISFALNRVFTEWYRSRGYTFDITNNTAFDQYYVHGRNIFENISRLVDEIFNEYIRRKGALNPLFAQYCNGTTVTCNGLSQWGTVTLAENGYSPLNILKYYYGNDIEVVSTNNIQAITSSYPGTPLRQGSVSPSVRILERELNRIRRNYPAIPFISSVDDRFTQETTDAVIAFQKIFNLSPDGVVGSDTWNRISYIYTAVTGLAELDGEQEPLPSDPPSGILRQGSRGELVKLAQYFLRVISKYYEAVRPISIDGIFGPNTTAAVRDFQSRFGLTVDGIIGPVTWNALYDVFMGIANTSGLVVPYPGTPLKEGSRGENVWLMQDYLRTLSEVYPIPVIRADGIFGPATREAVIAFQKIAGITPDGIIGPETWRRIVAARLL